MIHRISVKNFYSFRDETEIDFTVDKRTSLNSKEIENSSGVRAVKIKALFGPNASGKTNLLKVPSFVAWFLVRSFNGLEPNEEIPIQPFLFGKEVNEPTSIKMEFEIGRVFYKYQLDLKPERVQREVLWAREKKKLVPLFDRNWSPDQRVYSLNAIARLELPEDFERFIRQNASVISTAAVFGNKEFAPLLDYFSGFISNVTAVGKSSNPFNSFSDHLGEVVRLLGSNDDLRKEVVSMLLKYDLGLVDVEINKREGGGVSVYGVHRNTDGKTQDRLPFELESTGTKSLLILIVRMLEGLRGNQHLIILDEFEADLHPHVLIDILSIVYSQNTNPNNSQLLISTHALTLLDELGKDQIHFVEKDAEGVSHSWDLKEIKGVLRAENYFSKYFSGKYGAIPRIE